MTKAKIDKETINDLLDEVDKLKAKTETLEHDQEILREGLIGANKTINELLS